MAEGQVRVMQRSRYCFRESPTDTEQAMWFLLRNRRLAGYKFRRQHPIGPYVVDFCCKHPRLVVEVDGGQHNIRQLEDAARTKFLNYWGYTVLRFWNNDVLKHQEMVLNKIFEKLIELKDKPSPCPLPVQGEGNEI